MASITISEADFAALFIAANRANENGDTEQAKILDKIARKMDAALSRDKAVRLMGVEPMSLTWKDVPSTLID